MITTDYTKCLSCRWRDVNNVQCYDGHLQMSGKKECEGYEYSDISEKIKFEVQESKNDNVQTNCRVGGVHSLTHRALVEGVNRMDDLISRQAAIDALAKFVPYAICDESTESYTNGLTDAYYLILQLPSAQPEQRWIPCSERLPEYAEDVLFCDKYSFIAIGNYEDGRWRTDCGDTPDDVVAWMSLPDAYEEVNNK